MKFCIDIVMTLLVLWVYLVIYTVTGKVESEEPTGRPPATPPVSQPPAPGHNYNTRGFINRDEIQKSLQSDGNSLQDITRGVDNKEYESILDRLIELLKTGDNSNIQREVEEEDISDRAIEFPSIYGVNLDNIKHLHYSGKLRPGSATDTHTCDQVRKVPNYLRSKTEMWPEGIQDHYTKYTEAYKIPVIGSSKVTNKGMKRACYIVRLLFADRYDVKNAFFKMYGRVSLIGNGENTTDLPEHRHMNSEWDVRARGLGALVDNPTSSAGDDNLCCCCGDRYPYEDILIHELSHGAHLIAAAFVIPGFARRLAEAYMSAVSLGLWSGEYAATNFQEYWAVGSTYYFNTKGWYKMKKPNGVTVKGSGQTVLAGYDPTLLSLLQEVFPCNNKLVNRCAYKECTIEDFDKLKDKSAGLSLVGCDKVTTDTGMSVAECSALTCIRDGNAFNILSGKCEALKCSTFKFDSSQGGYNVFQLKSSVSFAMTLTEESTEVLTENCVKRDPSVADTCTSSNRNSPCGNVDKSTCKLRGCCYSGGDCFYSSQTDCADKILECNLAADTCNSNRYFMLSKCPFSCGVCEYVKHIDEDKTEGFCHDGHLDCKKWAESGECTKNPAYMYSVCPLSCNICDKEDRCDAVPSSKRISCDATVKEMCYMKGCCWKSGNCFHPSDCSDKLPECPVAAFKGECERNPNYMKVECPLSCGSCQASQSLLDSYSADCKDSNINCFQWSKDGECSQNPSFMLLNCKLSCDVCKL